jgi:hypothetical protein
MQLIYICASSLVQICLRLYTLCPFPIQIGLDIEILYLVLKLLIQLRYALGHSDNIGRTEYTNASHVMQQ